MYLAHWVPSGKLTELWKITIFNGKTHYKWPFSIAMLVIHYQRVPVVAGLSFPSGNAAMEHPPFSMIFQHGADDTRGYILFKSHQIPLNPI